MAHRPTPQHIRPFLGWRYAHRGLHSPDDPLENSMPAFSAAIASGHGIECDLRLSSDGVAFVFHDQMMERLTGAQGQFEQHSAAQLDAIPLREGNGAIPRLATLLRLAGDATPLLLELKIPPRTPPAPLCRAVHDELAKVTHKGAIMSFHPGVSRWFARHAPDVPRGLVMSERERRGIRKVLFRHLTWRYAKAQFFAYDIRDLPNPFADSLRRRGFPVFSWTIRTADEWNRVATFADAPIFEGQQQEGGTLHG